MTPGSRSRVRTVNLTLLMWTPPDPATLVNFLTRPDPTRGSCQQSCNSVSIVVVFVRRLQLSAQFSLNKRFNELTRFLLRKCDINVKICVY